jgi:hypothetical protein
MQVRQLVWHDRGLATAGWWHADSPVGEYDIQPHPAATTFQVTHTVGDLTRLVTEQVFGSVDAAKGAAQADFARRILACTVEPGHEVDAVHARAIAHHLADLVEFHHDDDAEQQHVDPVQTVAYDEGPAFVLTLDSGRKFRITVVEAT